LLCILLMLMVLCVAFVKIGQIVYAECRGNAGNPTPDARCHQLGPGENCAANPIKCH